MFLAFKDKEERKVLIPFIAGMFLNRYSGLYNAAFAVLIPFIAGMFLNGRERIQGKRIDVLIPFIAGMFLNRISFRKS